MSCGRVSFGSDRRVAVWNPRNWFQYICLSIPSWWIWSKETRLPFPIQQNGCRILSAETDVPSVYTHIPNRNVWNIGNLLNGKESWWAWFQHHSYGWVTVLPVLGWSGEHVFFLILRKFFTEIICQTINFSNFSLGEYSGNGLNVIIGHYKFKQIIAILLIFNELF